MIDVELPVKIACSAWVRMPAIGKAIEPGGDPVNDPTLLPITLI